MPGYVLTTQEADRLEDFLAPARFLCEELAVQFKTTRSFAREVLPPILEPAGSAAEVDAFASVSQFESAYCGTFDCAMVAIWARYRDILGYYVLNMVISNELPIVIGRELLGEPKKEGHTRVYRDGSAYHAVAERRGHSVLELRATIDGEDAGASTTQLNAFDIKMYPAASARGLEYPPRLNVWDVNMEISSSRTGTGSISWGASPWDHVHTIPVVETGEATVSNYVSYVPLREQVEIPDPENVYRRYLWGRSYDNPLNFPIADRWADVAATAMTR